MADPPALEAIGIHKRYGQRTALAGVDLVVQAGAVHGLLGPNGAGKTTLMRAVLGLVRPDAGAVRLFGRPTDAAARPVPEGVAGFADTPRFYPYLSGRENLRLMARLDGSAGAGAAERIGDVMGQVGMTAQAEAKVGGYSAGMRQRLGLAAALLRSPRLLLLDEPTSSLDLAAARDLRAAVRRLTDRGVAVLLSSHDMAEVEELCSVLTVMQYGKVIFSGKVEELRTRTPGRVHRLHTSDDARALSIGGADTTIAPDGDGLEVCADQETLDAYVIALGRAGIAVRRIEDKERSLEALFLGLTTNAVPPGPARPVDSPSSPSPRPDPPDALSAGGIFAVARTECAKLAALHKAWVVLAACLAAPFAFAAAMRLQSILPEDTLFGRWVKASGFATPLVVLGFAASWALPALSSVVGGDLFSAEDRYGTWPTVLTRSRTRGEVFAGKALTAFAFSLLSVAILGIGSTLAGTLIVGRQPLLGLSGNQLAPGLSLLRVAEAWASVLPPVLAFTSLAVLFSVATRSSAAGIGLPVLVGLLMELTSFVDGPDPIRRLLLTTPFVAWHGLFTEPLSVSSLAEGTAVSGAYLVGCLAAAYWLIRQRDMGV